MEVAEIHCKSILTRTTGYLKGVCSHSLNPYVGCGFGRSACGVGCYVRFNQWLTRGREWGSFVEAKVNAPEIYLKTCDRERQWARRRGVPFALFFSSATDPWQPLEQKYRVSRNLLRAMRESPPDQLVLQTHTDHIRDDLTLIAELSHLCGLRVHISIEGDRERLPGLPPPACSLDHRFRVLAEFADAGICTVACLSPLYPLDDPAQFFTRLASAGAAAVVIDHFIEGDGTPDGSRTRRTGLPEAMEKAVPGSAQLTYRDRIAGIARAYLPVGISASGFAGQFSS